MLIDKVAIAERPMLIVGRAARLVLGNARSWVVLRYIRHYSLKLNRLSSQILPTARVF